MDSGNRKPSSYLAPLMSQERSVRQEAFALLTESLAAMSPQPATAAKQAAFSSHLHDRTYLSDSNSPGPRFAVQLLRLYCERHPGEVAKFIDRHRPKVCTTIDFKADVVTPGHFGTSAFFINL
jgi:hypothetical protein